MGTPFFAAQRAAQMEAWAASIGCSPGDFAGEKLTILDRPEAMPWYSLLAVSFGLGTVLSVEPRFRAFVEEHAPSPAYRAFYPVLMQSLVDDCRKKGLQADYHVPGVCWALAETLPPGKLPPGFALRTVDPEWMAAEMGRRRWENGLGEPGGAQAREYRNRFGAALLDSDGQPAAIAGVFETYGMHEIGVDVAREHRGRGFGALVVRAAAAEILDRGAVPLYGCAANNIRSQRTALAAGFLPSFSDTAVSVAPASPPPAA
jgi:GNAT superfamily N-acetyltransferase